jgi:hypothetical protein
MTPRWGREGEEMDSISGRCKQCKWWAGRTEEPGDLALCLRAEDTEEFSRMLERTPGAGFSAESLVTGPEFGCVQFKRKAGEER